MRSFRPLMARKWQGYRENESVEPEFMRRASRNPLEISKACRTARLINVNATCRR